LDSAVLEHIFELLRSGLNHLVVSTSEVLQGETSNEQLNTHKNALKMYMFLLHWFLSMAKKSPPASSKAQPAASIATAGKGKGRARKTSKKDTDSGPSWTSETQKETLLSTMIHVLELDLSRVWKMTYPEDEFLNLFATTAYAMLEDATNTKSKPVKRCLFLMVSILVSKKYNQSLGVVNSLINLLHKCEHLAVPIAELMEVMVNEYQCAQVVGDILR
jgi:condensin complex subunit 1